MANRYEIPQNSIKIRADFQKSDKKVLTKEDCKIINCPMHNTIICENQKTKNNNLLNECDIAFNLDIIQNKMKCKIASRPFNFSDLKMYIKSNKKFKDFFENFENRTITKSFQIFEKAIKFYCDFSEKISRVEHNLSLFPWYDKFIKKYPYNSEKYKSKLEEIYKKYPEFEEKVNKICII